MKRTASDSMDQNPDNNPNSPGSGSKRSRKDDKFEIRLLIPNKAAGTVIGKGGENIKRLKSQYDAHLFIPNSQAPERIVQVGAATSNVVEIIRELLPKLKDRDDQRDSSEVRWLVHNSQAGAIIGKQAATVKKLKEDFGVNIKIFKDSCPNSSERVMLIGGLPDKICDAATAILDLIADVQIKGPDHHYDPGNSYDPRAVQEYGGYQPGPDWSGPRGGYGGGGGGYDPGPPPPMGGGYGGYGGGPGGYPAPQIMAYPYPGQYYGGPGGGRPDQQDTQQVTIPSELAGVIIGKGGTKLKDIRQRSGAGVVVEKGEEGAIDRIITMTGTKSQIQMAQYLLQDCVRNSNQGRQYIDRQNQAALQQHMKQQGSSNISVVPQNNM